MRTGAGHQSPPTPKLAQGPAGATREGTQSASPPCPPPVTQPSVRRRRRSGPTGARARRAKRGSRDSVVRARWARLPARRAATVQERPGRAGERRERSRARPGPGRRTVARAASREHVSRPRRRAPAERRGCGPARGAGPRRPGHNRTAGTRTSHSTTSQCSIGDPSRTATRLAPPPGPRSAGRGPEDCASRASRIRC